MKILRYLYFTYIPISVLFCTTCTQQIKDLPLPPFVSTTTGSGGGGGGGGGGAGSLRVFVTAKTFDGSLGSGGLGNLVFIDGACQSDANYPGSGTFKALIAANLRVACTTPNCGGGPSEHNNWVLKSNTTYTRVDGTTIDTTDSNGLFPYTLANTFTTTSFYVWTGLAFDWTVSTFNCSNWTNKTSSVDGIQADSAYYADPGYINDRLQNCAQLAKLYCVEQ